MKVMMMKLYDDIKMKADKYADRHKKMMIKCTILKFCFCFSNDLYQRKKVQVDEWTGEREKRRM